MAIERQAKQVSVYQGRSSRVIPVDCERVDREKPKKKKKKEKGKRTKEERTKNV